MANQLTSPVAERAARHAAQFSATMPLEPISRNPLRLASSTVAEVLGRPVPHYVSNRETTSPQTSIVVVTHNNLVFNRLCLESVLSNTDGPSIEILVVDNASTDGTAEYLEQLSERNRIVAVHHNTTNVGFAAAVNQALILARGESFVLLNNDTIVPHGWLAALLRHLDASDIGLVCPSTNRIGNEAEISTSYQTFGEFEQLAAEFTHGGDVENCDIRTAAMFCVAMRRSTFDAVGLLDEQFGLGMFEDDDYSMRVRAAGLRVACANDVFVHHFGQASFGKLAAAGEFGTLFHANRAKWEGKWNCQWQPHSRRENTDYAAEVQNVKRTIEEHVPPTAKLIVVTKGDDELLNLAGRQAAHFPQQADGSYAGHNPADAQAAIAQLNALRQQGSQYFVIPKGSFWWLDFYCELRDYLNETSDVVQQNADVVVYRLH